MIQANELRIGNLIADHEAGGDFQIEEIYKDSYGTYSASYRNCSIRCIIEELEPIHLTEEWLIKLGFKEYTDFGIKTNIFYLMPLCGFSYDIVTKQVTIFEQETGNNISHCIKRKIEYVHELQNLYFALRGQELTIKN